MKCPRCSEQLICHSTGIDVIHTCPSGHYATSGYVPCDGCKECTKTYLRVEDIMGRNRAQIHEV